MDREIDMCPECGERMPAAPDGWQLVCPKCGQTVTPIPFDWFQALRLRGRYNKRPDDEKQDGGQ